MRITLEKAREFNKINFPVVKATAGCIIIKNNKILLTKRSVKLENGKWCIPGGHIDIRETAEEGMDIPKGTKVINVLADFKGGVVTISYYSYPDWGDYSETFDKIISTVKFL